MKAIQEKRIFFAYEISLIFKATQAFLEVVAGMLLYAVSTSKITAFILTIAHGELAETPNDILSNFLIQSAQQFSTSGKFFVVFYLLTHGIIKLIIIFGLFFKKRWAFPASMLGFGSLILYQLYHLAVSYSVSLLVITLMDGIILWLIWHEHKMHKN